MKSTVQARLDPETQKAIGHLVRRLGWSSSKVVREGVRLLAACHPSKGRSRIVGVGKFVSGVKDLGSNKAHLGGFGR